MTTIVIYAAGFILWPFVFRAAAARLLGIRVGRVSGLLSGAAGIAIGAAASSQVPRGATNLAVFVLFGLVGTAACVTALNFVARPQTMARLERSVSPPVHPLRAVRRRLARGLRYLEVIRIAVRHRLASGLATPAALSAREGERFGRELTQALQEAGGIFVKLGQVLSTRPDLLPPVITEQLAVLQDRVAPAPVEAIEALLQAELARPASHVFARFDAAPMAAASISQVHRAQLHDGRDVVVKVQRPDVEERVERDLDIILELANRIDASTDWGRRVRALELAHGFAANLREELDFRIEARNTETLGKLLQHRPRLRVPAVHERLSTRRVLVLEWLDGTPLREAGPRLQELGIERRSLGRELLASFLEQVLELGVFTADPHPGNVLLLADGTLAQIDFGSVGRLHRLQQLALAHVLIAVNRSDPELLRGALLDLAATSEPIDLDALDRALAQFLAQRLGPGSRPGAEMFTDLLAMLTGFGLAFEPQLAGVFRALLTLEGTLRTLDPDLVLVEEVKAMARDVAHRTFGPTALRQAMTDDLLKLGPILRKLPKRLDRIASAMERDQWGINVRLLSDERDARFITRLVDRAIVAFISAAIGVISAVLITADGGVNLTEGLTLPDALGYTGLAVATILGLRVLVAITRDRVV